MKMKNLKIQRAIEHWNHIAPLVAYPNNDKEFNKLVAVLDELLDIMGENEDHNLSGLVDIMSNVITTYEAQNYPDPIGKGIDALKYLMDSHHLHQADLPEIASQGVMSEILCGKRSLNLRQIKLLAKRFNVDSATFID